MPKPFRAQMSTFDTLSAFSQWLDTSGFMKDPDDEDVTTHDQLAGDFIRYWDENPRRALLAGTPTEPQETDKSEPETQFHFPDPELMLQQAHIQQAISEDSDRKPASAMKHKVEAENYSLLAIAGYLRLLWGEENS